MTIGNENDQHATGAGSTPEHEQGRPEVKSKICPFRPLWGDGHEPRCGEVCALHFDGVCILVHIECQLGAIVPHLDSLGDLRDLKRIGGNLDYVDDLVPALNRIASALEFGIDLDHPNLRYGD